jgi:LysM repeat protein
VVRLDPRSSVAETTVPTETALVTTPTIVGSLPVGISDATLVHPEEGTYVIVAGDFPANIAQKFKVRFGDLMGINGWTLVGNVVPEFPPVGTTIRIPPGWTAPAGSVATTTAITATTGS